MKTAALLKPVPALREEPYPLNRDLSARKRAALRRRVVAAEARPAPGSSDLLASSLWHREEGIGARTVHVHDLVGHLWPAALKRKS